MRYRIKKLSNKKNPPYFKIQLVTYLVKGEKTSDLPKERWEADGFYFDMSLEQAKERALQLNSLSDVEKKAKAQAKRDKELKDNHEIESAFLPRLLVLEFEKKLEDDFYGEDFIRSKQMSRWRAAKRTIRDCAIPTEDYEDKKRVFYKYFIENSWSMDYSKKLIALMNKWSRFSGRKTRSYCEEIPLPTGQDRERINDANIDSGKRSKESDPIYPMDLIEVENSFSEPQFFWLSLSLWFGLRPIEVDRLKKEHEGKFWRITKQQEGRKSYLVLEIYQSKLTAVSREKRWKKIPCLFDEQKNLIKKIGKEEPKSPLVKTIKRYLGEGVNRYGGRKGFEKMMRKKKVPFDASSSYLGHQNVDRTWKNYRDTSEAIIVDV